MEEPARGITRQHSVSFACPNSSSFSRGSTSPAQSFQTKRRGSILPNQDDDRESFERSKTRHQQTQNTVNSLLSFKSQAGESLVGDIEVFRKEVMNNRARIRTISKSTIDPRSRFVRVWDGITICALLFTASVTPFEVAFFEARLTNGPVNFAFNRVVDTVFVLDILISFFLPYRESHRNGGNMVYDHKKIVSNYLRGWFALDALTCVPFDLIFYGIAMAGKLEVDANVFRLMRMFRVLKLMRIIRASRIISRWQDQVAVSFAIISLVKFSTGILILAHWLACLWGFIGVKWNELPESTKSDLHAAGHLYFDPLTDSLELNGTAWGLHDGMQDVRWRGYHLGMSWRQKAGIADDVSPYHLYGQCLYVALNNIFGGSCEVNPGAYAEFYVQAGMLLIGSSLWAYVIGSACGIVATLDPSRIEFRQTLDELNYFAREQGLPKELAVRLRAYFRNTIHSVRSRRYMVLLNKMSTRLRGDAAFHMCEFRLKAVPFLVHPDLEPEFMCNLAFKCTMNVYSYLERVPCTDLFVVERGVVAKHGHLGVCGSCFGKDVILSNDSLRDIGDAIAMTFVQTISLSQRDIFDLLIDYPMAYLIVRKAALRMALIRSLVKAAEIVRRSKNRSGSIIEMFDRALREAGEARQAQLMEERDKKADIPLSLNGGLSGGIAQVMKLQRQRKAMAEAQKSGAPQRKGWGKLKLDVATGEAVKQISPPKERGLGSPSLLEEPGGVKLREAQRQDPMSQIIALDAKVDAAHEASLEKHAAVLGRLAGLENALSECVAKITMKVEERSFKTSRLARSKQKSGQSMPPPSSKPPDARASASPPPASRQCSPSTPDDNGGGIFNNRAARLKEPPPDSSAPEPKEASAAPAGAAAVACAHATVLSAAGAVPIDEAAAVRHCFSNNRFLSRFAAQVQGNNEGLHA